MKSIELFWGFLAVGSVNTILTYGLYLVALPYLHYSIAYTVAFAAGIALSYFLNVTFVFKGRHSIAAILKFPLVYLVQYVYSLIMLTGLIEVFRISRSAAMLIVIATSVLISFFLVKTIFGTSP